MTTFTEEIVEESPVKEANSIWHMIDRCDECRLPYEGEYVFTSCGKFLRWFVGGHRCGECVSLEKNNVYGGCWLCGIKE